MEKISLLQLIEGLRPEWKKSILELGQLKEYISMSDNRIKDYSLLFWQNDTFCYGIEKPELVIWYNLAENEYKKDLPFAINQCAFESNGQIKKFYRNLNNRYIIKDNKYKLWVFDQESFHRILEQAIDSDFYKNIYKTIETDKGNIDIKANGITYNDNSLDYIAASDFMFVNNMSDEELQEPIVPCDELNEFQKKSIVNNLRVYYPIEIIRNKSNSCQYEIKEEKNKTLILQK